MHQGEFMNRQSEAPGVESLEKPSLSLMMTAQAEQLAICRELEDIADSLPSAVNRQKCIFAAQALGPLIKMAHSYEENIFFPWLETHAHPGEDLDTTLTRLKFEHFEDECYAEELVDALLRLGRGDQVNMEATGYMLRGFFEALRRHIAFERDHLMRSIRA